MKVIATSPYFFSGPQVAKPSVPYTQYSIAPPSTIGSTSRPKITAGAHSFDRMPACISFSWTALTWLSCSIFIDDNRPRILSAVSLRWTSLARRLVEAVMPAFSCSRRSFSALTRLVIGSLTVVAA